MRFMVKSLAVVAALVGSRHALANATAPQATAAITVGGGAPINIPLVFSEEDNGYIVDTRNGAWSYRDNEAEISGLTLFLKPDPIISWGISVIDIGAPSAFGFVFTTPIVPTGSPNVVQASISGGLNDPLGDGVSLTPISTLAQMASVGAPITSMGVDVGPAVSYPAGTPGANYTYGAYTTALVPGPGPGPWTTLSTTTSFTASGGGDIYALTGFARIDAVPEPAALSLLLLAAPLALERRRRA